LRNKDWGFDKHGAVKLTKEEKAALPGGKKEALVEEGQGSAGGGVG
jgi:hypothetical protein